MHITRNVHRLIISLVIVTATATVQAELDHSGFFPIGYGSHWNCQTCHTDQAEELMDSVHYLWRSENPLVEYPGGGAHGMVDRACGLVGSNALINYDESCGKCHVGSSLPFPDPTTGQFTQQQMQGLDCMVCHAPDGMYDTNNDGLYEFGELADEKPRVLDEITGQWKWHTEQNVESARSVGGRVTNEACLRCHHHGQADYHYKRGTPFDPENDVHAAAGLFCTDCHEAAHHKIARGSRVTDMFAWERQDVDVNCEKCHTSAPHEKTPTLNAHTDKIGCETCHIPHVAGAERRIWAPTMGVTQGPESQVPVFDPETGKWLPYSKYNEELVSPSYRWFTGAASMLAEPIANPGNFDMQPATRETPGAKILPFRNFVSGQPMDGLGIIQMPDTFNPNFTMAGALNSMAPMLKQAGFMRPEGMTPQEEAMMSQFPNMLLFDRAEYFESGDLTAAISIGMAKMGATMMGTNTSGMSREELISMGSTMWSGVIAGLDLPDNPYAPTYKPDNDPTTVTGSSITVSHAIKLDGALSCMDCHTKNGRLNFTELGYSEERQAELLDPAAFHSTIQQYDGPETCVNCHDKQAKDMFTSVHYQWNGETPNVTNIEGKAGKHATAMNTYCAAVNTTRGIVCKSCHVSNGKPVSDVPSQEQYENIDCLMCHQDQYKRKFTPTVPTGDFNKDYKVNLADFAHVADAWTSKDPGKLDLTYDDLLNIDDIVTLADHWLDIGGVDSITYVGYDDVERHWKLPNESLGHLTAVMDTANMSITPLEAAQTVHMPTRASCLRCHATAGGGNNVKRGDLSTDSVNPEYHNDIHLSSDGANLTCQDCHETVDHKVLGRGIDIRVNDRPERMVCDNGTCHTSTPHSYDRLNDHTGRIACQTCHIPTYGKVVATETHRDWLQPHWVQGVYGGQGGFKPTEYKEGNLTPTYSWFDGTSYIQKLGEPAILRPDGYYETAIPNGDVQNGKIYPIKEHTTTSVMHDETHQFIPFNVSKYFFTGSLDVAVVDGLDELGLSGDWSVVNAHASHSINHGVEPVENALQCGDCHADMPTSMGGGPARMNLTADFGYAAPTQGQTCLHCHDTQPRNLNFTQMHWQHVTEEEITCKLCHEFDRPERTDLADCTTCH